MAEDYLLTACASRQCLRKVRVGSHYCCGPCDVAWNSLPRYSIDGEHSPGCDQRAVERGEWSPDRADAERAMRPRAVHDG